jgi:hemoglobin
VSPPALRHDLDDPDQVNELVRRFYADVAQDDLLGPMFNDVAQVDWSEHLPKLAAFWCRVLFGTPGYAGNPFRAHKEVHLRQAFTAAHFRRWLELFEDTIVLGWVGPHAERALSLAREVGRVHQHQLTGEGVPVTRPKRSVTQMSNKSECRR